jgi:hypothetical protein
VRSNHFRACGERFPGDAVAGWGGKSGASSGNGKQEAIQGYLRDAG